MDYKCASTNAERKQALQNSGIKYSEMILIPNFNVIRCHVIDPMHCIFLGLAKYTIQIWKEDGILHQHHFKMLQEKVDVIIPPSKVGRISRKIESGFGPFTADEWKTGF